jgi:trigger factor
MKKKYMLLAVFTAATMLTACGKETATQEGASETQAEATTEASGETTAEAGTLSENYSDLKTTTLMDLDLDKLVQLGDYKGITVEITRREITDEDVEDSLNSAYSANPLMTEVTDRAIQNGDTANIDFEGKYADTKEAFEGGTSQGYDLKIGSGSFIPGFEDGLVGVGLGETVDLNLTFPEDYGSADLAGKDVIFTVKVNSIKVAAEEPTDEWVAGLGLDDAKTLDEFRTHLRKELEQDAQEEYDQQLKNTAVEQVVGNATVDEIPEELINRYYIMVRKSVESYVQQMQMIYGAQLTIDDYIQNIMQSNGISGTSEDYLRDIANQQAKRCMVLQAIADKEVIEISQETIDQYIQEDYDNYFKQSYDSVDAYKETVITEDYREQIMAERVADFIVENATIKAAE